MSSSSGGRRSTLDVTVFILRGKRSTLEESCCVFFANHIVRAASSGDNVQIPWQAWHFVRCAENWRKPRTKHRFWGRTCLRFTRFHKHTRRKTSILKLQSVKIGGISHEMLVLMLQHVSSRTRVSGFPVASPCLWGKLQNLSCFKVSKPVVTWFCVRGVAVHDILMCLQTCRKSFCVASAILWCSFQKMSCIVPGKRSTLETSIVILPGTRSISDVSHYMLYTPDSTPYTPHSTLHTPHFTLHTLHSTLYTLHFALHTLHSTHYTPHSTLHTPHSALHTLHSTLQTLHSTLYTLHSHSTLYTPHFTLHARHSALYTPHSTLYTPDSKLSTPHSTLYTLYALYTPHFILYTLHSTLYTPHFTLYTLHSTLHTLHSTLCTLHSTLYTPHFTLHTSHSTLMMQSFLLFL